MQLATQPRGEAKPSQLGFYSGPWLDVLVDTRNSYRRMIHTSAGEAFPERNPENLMAAHNILLEAISEYMNHGGQLDECLYLSFFISEAR